MSDIDTAVVDSLKVLDPDRPIREADIASALQPVELLGLLAKLLVQPSENEGLILAQPVRGFASMVQRKGFAMVRLKYAMNSSILVRSAFLLAKLPRRRSFRTRMENQISIWLSQEACLGVKWKVTRCCG